MNLGKVSYPLLILFFINFYLKLYENTQFCVGITIEKIIPVTIVVIIIIHPIGKGSLASSPLDLGPE